jgi:glycosyltransferase involved in cell wall biosynthesis
MKRLALVTDAWHPQANGVVNTLSRLANHLRSQGTEVLVISADEHQTFSLPTYPDIQLAMDPWRAIPRLRAFKPDAVHIATEGPLGFATSMWLRHRRLRFTTSFHTRFPEYLSARFPMIPLGFGYAIERWFHARAERTMVGTQSMIDVLRAERVGKRLVHWPRGVDTERFHPRNRRHATYGGLPGPIWLYVGRVACEKQLEDFLDLSLPGTKVVVGDGPSREELQRRYPEAVWRGWRDGADLAAHFASADCFVFPSRTETFGNVLLEALASGLPVASIPAPGPIDLIKEGCNGSIHDELRIACLRALRCEREVARASALPYTVSTCHEIFESNLVPLVHALPSSAGAASPHEAQQASAY